MPRRCIFPRPGGLWRQPDFLKLWAGHTISLLGSQVTLVALPLVAIVTLQASPLQVGLLAAVGSLPTLLFGLAAGVWADRLRRRPLMIAADLGRALALLAVPAGALTGRLSIEWLYAVAFLTGALGLVGGVAAAAFLPTLVGRERLVDAGGKLSLSAAAAEVAGPGLAGGLTQLLTAPVAIAVDAASFLASAACLGAIRVAEPTPEPPPEGRRFWPEARAGLLVVLGHPLLRPLVGSTGWVTFWSHVLEAVSLLYLTRELGLSPAVVGVVFAVSNVGFLVGAAGAARVVARLGVGMTLVIALVATGLADLATPLVGVTPLVGAAPLAAAAILTAAQFAFGLAVVIFTITSGGLRQACTPDPLRGRMAATTRVLVAGMTPLGSLMGGALGELIGLPATLVLAAVGELLAAAWLLASPLRALREMPAAVD
jgi:MFS family permease